MSEKTELPCSKLDRGLHEGFYSSEREKNIVKLRENEVPYCDICDNKIENNIYMCTVAKTLMCKRCLIEKHKPYEHVLTAKYEDDHHFDIEVHLD